jgi:hypothetical protein
MYLGNLAEAFISGKATLLGYPIDEEQQLALTILIGAALDK